MNDKTRCIIVDDEPLAIEVIQSYLVSIGGFEIVAKCNNALSAFKIIQDQKVDLIFLDIQMPKLSGINFLKSLSDPPKVIITTAYRDYAIIGYELDVMDYLLKPISLERFMKAIDKFYSYIRSHVANTKESSTSIEGKDFIYLKSNRKLLKIMLCDIILVEGMKDYILVHTSTSKIITKEKMSEIEIKLSGETFIRVHKSFIVSIDKIVAISPQSIEIGKNEIPIGRSYKKSVFDKLKC